MSIQAVDGRDEMGDEVDGTSSRNDRTLEVLTQRIARAAHQRQPIVVDVSAVTLLRDEVGVLLALVRAAPSGTLSVVCSRLTGRRLLRRILPSSVPVLFDPPSADPGCSLLLRLPSLLTSPDAEAAEEPKA